ncbi:MAG: hypothetical protein H6R17_4264 [Proteobacteria bacterium]|nr:hypothetical protein [Pseudomonadota bacterium]
MKPINALKNRLLGCAIAAVLLGSAALAAAADAEPVIQAGSNVSYVSGGVGDESLARLTAITGEYNVKLVFARTSGEYLSNVRVEITDAKGRNVVDSHSDGPWFLIRLPAGHYQIVASLGDKAEKRAIDVGTSKLSTLDFRWAAE